MRVTLRQLAHAEALARHGQFRDAALELHITQPALTRSIQALEKALGGRLFDRSAGEVTPTPAGELVLQRARRVLPALQELEQDTRALLGLETGSLAISTGPYPGYLLVPQAVAAIARQYPGLSIRLREVDWTEVEDQLLNRESDIAIADLSLAREDPRFKTEALGQDKLFYFCRPGHPLAGGSDVSPQEIRRFPLAGNKVPRRMVRALGGDERLGEVDPVTGLFHPRIETATISALKQIVRATDAVSLCPPIFLERELRGGELVLINTRSPQLALDSGFIHLSRKTLSPASSAFVEAAKAIRLEHEERTGNILAEL